MVVRTLKVPAQVRKLIRELHPRLKKKVRLALEEILADPHCGKELHKELASYRSLRVGRYRVIYRPNVQGVEIVAIGPRQIIYEEIAREFARERVGDPED